MQSGLLTSGFNCILQMPTGSGKTRLSLSAIAEVLKQGKRAIYLTPLKALASELNTHWQQYFAPKRVGIFTGDYRNQSYPIPYQEAHLLVMTPEKLDACTRHWQSHWSWIPEIDLVVVDEFHLLGDPNRGGRLEGALLRFIRLNPFARILGLSATLGNRQELAAWLKGVEYYSNQRPVPLHWKVVRYKRAQDKPNLLLQEVAQNRAAEGKTLVFVQSRRRAEVLAKFLQESEIRAAHHHAGLVQTQRQQVEHDFRSGNLEVLIATATLEMGVNLPARQVILYDLQGFDGTDFIPLSVNSVWQRAGRAGRLGLDPVGEVVLLAPVWERSAENYAKGQFEPIRSQLCSPIALAEQVIAEVASQLCRTKPQLEAVLSQSLAAFQGSLPPTGQVIADMLQAGMLVEQEIDNGTRRLKATSLGFVATRHMIAPNTVLLFKRVIEAHSHLNFFDLLLLVASSEDCQPIIPVDFEQLEELAVDLKLEPSVLLGQPYSELRSQLGIDGKRLLAAVNTALTVRTWTRLGDPEAVAQVRGCYAFEVECLRESMQRLLLAMIAVVRVVVNPSAPSDADNPPVLERLQALVQMVSAGLDEGAATLTLVPGIGAKLAKRLQEFGIGDIEDLALALVEELVEIPGIAQKRAQQWVDYAEEIVDQYRSSYRYKEEVTQNGLLPIEFPADLDPYRLRRSLELRIADREGTIYRVVGGLDPHRVIDKGQQYECDCPDFGKGNTCKHILAVRLHQGDSRLKQWVAGWRTDCSEPLDLVQLWLGSSAKCEYRGTL